MQVVNNYKHIRTVHSSLEFCLAHRHTHIPLAGVTSASTNLAERPERDDKKPVKTRFSADVCTFFFVKAGNENYTVFWG